MLPFSATQKLKKKGVVVLVMEEMVAWKLHDESITGTEKGELSWQGGQHTHTCTPTPTPIFFSWWHVGILDNLRHPPVYSHFHRNGSFQPNIVQPGKRMIFSRKSFFHFEVLKKKKDQEWALENSVCCEEIVTTPMFAGGWFMHELFPSYDLNSPGRMMTSACVMSTRKETNIY